MSKTPKTSLLTKLYCSKTLGGEKKHIAYVQSVPPLKPPKEPITYSALDLEEEQQAKGTRKAETLTIPILYTELQHDYLNSLAAEDDDNYFFVQLPEETAETVGKPLTWYFKASIDLSNDTIEIDGMLQENITLYKSSPVLENKGFPEE